MQEFTGRLTRPNTRNVTARFLHIVGDLQFIKLGRHPEVREEQDQQAVNEQIKDRSSLQTVGHFVEERDLECLAQVIENHVRKHQNGGGENDRHDARVINAQ